MGSVLASGLSATAGLLALAAGRGRWGWATGPLPELAGWLVIPGLVGLALATATRPFPPRSGAARGAFGFALAAVALSGWPLAVTPLTTAQLQSAIRRAIGAASPAGLASGVAGRVRPEPLSARDYVWGIAIAPAGDVRELVYRTVDGVDLRLDLYLPSAPGPHPVVVVVHGGGWSSGTRGEQAALNHYLAAREYAVAAIDYRLAPEWPYPAALEDVRAAVAFVAGHATEYGLDPARVVLLGRSAGGHLALLAGFGRGQPSLGGARIAGIVAYYAPTDLAAFARHTAWQNPIDSRETAAQFLGADVDAAPERYAEASPLRYADGPVPPTLLVYGARDVLVPVEQGRRLAARLETAGNRVVYLELPWSGHSFDVAFSGLGHQLVLYALDRFLGWATARARGVA